MYRTEGGDTLTDAEMARLIDEARRDGCSIDYVQGRRPGVLVREPADADRFYALHDG